MAKKEIIQEKELAKAFSDFETAMKARINHIRIWKFDDAPEELQALSRNGGDEDWVALIPPKLVDEWIPFLEQGTSFGCCSVREYEHPELPGYKVRIGSHA